MNISQTGITHSVNNIEASALYMLVSEVENTTVSYMQLQQPPQEYYKQTSQDSA
ncbi:hypothetical protein GCM10009426_20400 [Rheinheimera tangshanensis]|jgi:hypothetical protein|nr:hypothetical protein GCM10010920_28640 [Rheinheimera tangshanensis]